VWRVAEAEQTSIETKHEGQFAAFRVHSLKENRGNSAGANAAAAPEA
jgi:hypothetical protein